MLVVDDTKDCVDVTGMVDTTCVRPVRRLRRERINPPHTYLFIKRIFDVSISALGLVALSPLMLLAALAIKGESEGPIFYRQVRLGKNGEPFTMVKLRSMYIDAEQKGPQWASDHDSRVTKVGAILRATRFDEVPQLAQVIAGKMSLVGPRPERPEFYEQFEKYLPGFSQRLAIKPGVTGLAQVNGGYCLTPEEKVLYDLDYIESMSAWLDLKILVKTVRVLFSHEGAR